MLRCYGIALPRGQRPSVGQPTVHITCYPIRRTVTAGGLARWICAPGAKRRGSTPIEDLGIIDFYLSELLVRSGCGAQMYHESYLFISIFTPHNVQSCQLF